MVCRGEANECESGEVMKIHAFEQRSPEWFQSRLGRLTGSRASDMLATVQTKGKEAASRRNLRIELALERITGVVQERGFMTQAMQDGVDREADALLQYQAHSGETVHAVGFIEHDDLMAGYSPDGIIGDLEGFTEVKCPEQAAHLESLSGRIPDRYMAQMTHGFWITGAAWCDFVSFHPLFPEKLRLKVVRIQRPDLTEYAAKATAFLAEVDEQVKSIQRMMA